MLITDLARSKIQDLQNRLNSEEPFRIMITGSIHFGNLVDLIPNSKFTPFDSVICESPVIIADLDSVNYLTGKKIDFDPEDDEFIISERG